MAKKILVVLILGIAALAALGYAQRGKSGTLGVSAVPDVGGKIAYARNGAIWLYAGGKQQQLTEEPKDRLDKRDAQPSLSPDGTQIVYVRFDEGFSDIYKLDLSEPSEAAAITHNRPNAGTGGYGYAAQALWAMQPAWSPNGERIAYTSDVGTEYPGLFSMGIEGESRRKLEYLDHSIQAVENPTWSPDGAKIAVTSYLTRGSLGQIWVLDTESGTWTELTDSKDGAYDPAWSPDGEWLAFTMRDGTANNIYAAPTDAEKWTEEYPTPIRLSDDGASRSPVWSPDGSRLSYLSLKEGSFDLYAAEVNFDTGDPALENPQRLTEKAGIDTSGLSWSE